MHMIMRHSLSHLCCSVNGVDVTDGVGVPDEADVTDEVGGGLDGQITIIVNIINRAKTIYSDWEVLIKIEDAAVSLNHIKILV